MLPCEHIPCLLHQDLHNFRVAQVTGMPFRTIIFFFKAKRVGLFSLPEILFPVGSFQRTSSWRAARSRTLTFSFGLSLSLTIVFHCTQISSKALTFRCPMCAISTVSFSLSLRLALGCSGARGGLFKLPFTRREMLLAMLLLQVLDHHFFFQKVWCSLAMHSFEQYLECTETAMAFAVLTVGAVGNLNYPEFPRRVASSSRLWFLSVCCHSSNRPSKSHARPSPRRIRLCRWP